MVDYSLQLEDLFDSISFKISDIKPSEWGEQNRVMSPDVSPIPGKLSYKNSPYTREIVDCLSPDHPAKIIAVMKGAQIGFSTTVIEVGIGWIISQNPGNILFLVGHEDLVKDAMDKVDKMIDSTGIRHLIKSSVQRAKNNKTGDTDKIKHFPNGQLKLGHANHKVLRNISMQYGFIDDFEAMKGASKESGSTSKLVEQRFAAFNSKMKLFYISTPELKQTSNIEPQYLLGDQRRYMIPCPCCGDFITLEWELQVNDEKAGIVWKIDNNSRLIPDSVGYVCQSCAGFFQDRQKDKLLFEGFWKPTAEPQREGQYSYHISSLYAPGYMFGWKEYVYDYLKACPPGQARKEAEYKTFVNLVEGKTYEQQVEEIKANDLQKNCRDYDIGVVPESMSERDGNGKVILLACGADLNGVEDDARLDYEIVAFTETGSTYSVCHGSIGTFIPRENQLRVKEDRERWTYQFNKPNSVWDKLTEVLDKVYMTDTGRKVKVAICGIDTGHYTSTTYYYIDNHRLKHTQVVGVKGEKEHVLLKYGVDVSTYKPAKERGKLYLLQVNKLKDDLADLIRLKWDKRNDPKQPLGFMNYPLPGSGLYTYSGFFQHYESEQRIVEETKDGLAFVWKKKTSVEQNHFWDCRIYAMAVRDILLFLVSKELKIPKLSWFDYCSMLLGRK